MVRSIWKGPYIKNSLLKKITKENTRIQTWSRSSLILPEFVGRNLEVYNGKKFIAIQIREDMVGHKLGEFSMTRKIAIHKKK